MKPELAQFGSTNKKTKLVKINIDEKGTPEWKKYGKYLTSRSIPFTVILDRKGKKLTDFTGFKNAEGLKAVVDSTFKAKK